jgi:rubrerythrin
VALARGDVSVDGVQRDPSASASEQARQEKQERDAPSKWLKRAAHLAYYNPTRMAQDPIVHSCWVCGAIMREIKCKIVCPQCGYTRDCSDP